MLPFSFPGFEIQKVSIDGARLCLSARATGPGEGQINRLKFIKRSMYGRGSFELLRQRVWVAA